MWIPQLVWQWLLDGAWHLLGVTGCKEAFKNLLAIALVASELEKVRRKPEMEKVHLHSKKHQDALQS